MAHDGQTPYERALALQQSKRLVEAQDRAERARQRAIRDHVRRARVKVAEERGDDQ